MRHAGFKNNSITIRSDRVTDNYHPASTLGNKAIHSSGMPYSDPEKRNKLTRETFLQEHKELYLQEKHPYFEWAVIVIFLIILVSGLYLIKPSTEPANEFSEAPFEFTEVTETISPPIPDTIVPAQQAKSSNTDPQD